jgi:Flp pilus assembly protein TadG
MMVREAAVSAHDLPLRFWRDRRGAVAVAVAVLLPVLIGLAGIGIEILQTLYLISSLPD